ncbi:hypothetical protein [Alloactinosynnema sp. L-07]|uniref:hypothetical protein n=1 Tax=Alloactinosynnema sp. L-07 TaxID=1653480 RepID=UPI00065EFB8E|nr:hypothetical protein [Alloactinosynnema sp. L-07]CRK61451.1 hypothetical protein [Alloactinosynnema sp. L-07]
MATHPRRTVMAPFRLPAHLLPTATIVTATGVPALLIHTPVAAWAGAATCATALLAAHVIKSLRDAARRVDRILAEELAADHDSQLIG